jgi:hypothetical protein
MNPLVPMEILPHSTPVAAFEADRTFQRESTINESGNLCERRSHPGSHGKGESHA